MSIRPVDLAAPAAGDVVEEFSGLKKKKKTKKSAYDLLEACVMLSNSTSHRV